MTLRPYGADRTKFDRGFIEMLGIAKQQKQLMWHASNENYGNYRCFFFGLRAVGMGINKLRGTGV